MFSSGKWYRLLSLIFGVENIKIYEGSLCGTPYCDTHWGCCSERPLLRESVSRRLFVFGVECKTKHNNEHSVIGRSALDRPIFCLFFVCLKMLNVYVCLSVKAVLLRRLFRSIYFLLVMISTPLLCSNAVLLQSQMGPKNHRAVYLHRAGGCSWI